MIYTDLDEMEHWFLLAEDVLLDYLERAQLGDNPGTLLAELWAQGKHYDDPGDDEIVQCADSGITTFSLTPRDD